jgi:DNA-binding CsgD family transcriptional regulator/tetratricopeptide (TPR) repeat protein
MGKDRAAEASHIASELLDRGGELALLEECLGAVRRGSRGRLVLVSGEAGIGKTALLRRFCDGADSAARLLWGGCDPLFTPRALGPLLDIAQLIGGELARSLESDARPADVATALMCGVSKRAPTILVFEDIHWADEATLDVLGLLGRRIERIPVLLVATYRDELDRTHPLRAVLGELAGAGIRRLKLSPLSLDAVTALAGRQHVDAEQLYRKTGGNPFFVTEALAAGGDELPESVRDAVLARASRLSPAARTLLEAVAISPTQCEFWLLESLYGAALEPLEECVASGMLEARSRGVAFRHELSRLALEGSLPTARRVALHRHALTLVANPPAAAPDLARLAHHAEAAGDARAVLRYSPAAAARAAAVGAHREAAAFYASAVPFADEASVRAGLRDSQAREAFLTGEFAEALEACGEALAGHRVAGAVSKQAASLRLHARLLLSLGRDQDAIAEGKEAVALLETLPRDRELAVAYANLSEIAAMGEDPEPALVWGQRALELAHEFDDRETESQAAVSVGDVGAHRGDPAGVAKLERTLEGAIEAGFESVAARAFESLVSAAVRARNFAAMDGYLSRGVDYCSERDLGTWRQSLVALGARADLDRGRWTDAAAGAERVLRTARTQAAAPALARSVLALVRARRGDPGVHDALAFPAPAGGARKGPSPAAPPTSKMYLAAARAEVAWLEQKPAAVREATDEALGIAVRAGAGWMVGELAYWRWRAGIVEEIPVGVAEPYALSIRGEWRRAAECWAKLGCPYEAALALVDADDEGLLRRGLDGLQQLEASAAAAILARRLRERGVRGLPRGPRLTTQQNPAGITRRELEVLSLLAQGLRNAEIAERLVVSPKTIDHHVSAILRKLDARTRGEAVAKAGQSGLLYPEHESSPLLTEDRSVEK